MKFYGVIEASSDRPFMVGHPILGIALLEDERLAIGLITGDKKDLLDGHISSSMYAELDGSSVLDYISYVSSVLDDKDFLNNFNLTVCTYQEACKRALELYEGDTWDIESIGGGVVTIDMRLTKNNLQSVLTGE